MKVEWKFKITHLVEKGVNKEMNLKNTDIKVERQKQRKSNEKLSERHGWQDG